MDQHEAPTAPPQAKDAADHPHPGDRDGAQLAIPAHVADEDIDRLTAGLGYGKAGWYMAPVRRGDYKNPGSRVGKNWPSKSFRDPENIIAAFAGSDDGIALHLGRSGAIAFDVDNPEQLPAALAAALDRDRPPKQRSRRDGHPGRAHYLYALPAGRMIGNSKGALTGGWGEVRGRNGVIVVAPSVHEKTADGGHYHWERTGPLPTLPDELDRLLLEAGTTVSAATDPEIDIFLRQHTRDTRPDLLAARIKALVEKYNAGESRHDTTVPFTAGAMEEARAGFYPSADAARELGQLFVHAVTRPRPGDPAARVLTLEAAKAEYIGILAWAVGTAATADLDKVRRRVNRLRDDQAVLRPRLGRLAGLVHTVLRAAGSDNPGDRARALAWATRTGAAAGLDPGKLILALLRAANDVGLNAGDAELIITSALKQVTR